MAGRWCADHVPRDPAATAATTGKAVMRAVHILHDILRALNSGIPDRFLDALARAINYLAGRLSRFKTQNDPIARHLGLAASTLAIFVWRL